MRNRRLYFGILALLALLIVPYLLVYKLPSSPIVIEGIVDHKVITGMNGDTSYTILLNRPADNGSWIIVKDKDYERFFKGEKNAFITKSIENEMKKKYSDIKYLVSIRLDSRDPINGVGKGGTLAYFVSRDEFNRVKIGDKVKFEVSREKCLIKRILQIEKTALVGGLFIAFEEDVTKGEVLSLLDECNVHSIYAIKGVDYMSQKYYAIVSGDKLKEIEFLHNNFKDVNTIYYSDGDVVKKGKDYVIFFEGDASLDDAKQILKIPTA